MRSGDSSWSLSASEQGQENISRVCCLKVGNGEVGGVSGRMIAS